MSRRSSSGDGCLFVGRLSKSCRVRDLEDVFEPYGRMSRCEIKYAYAFVDYEDRRDAEDAIRYENGREVAGSAIIVEWSKGNPRRSGPPSRDSRNRGRDECYRCRRSGHWARDCPDDRNFGYRRPSSRRSRSPRRRRSRSRSRSRDRRRSRSRSRDRRRSRSRDRRSHSGSDRSRSNSRSRSKSRSRTPEDKKEQVNNKEDSKSRSPTPVSNKDTSE